MQEEARDEPAFVVKWASRRGMGGSEMKQVVRGEGRFRAPTRGSEGRKGFRSSPCPGYRSCQVDTRIVEGGVNCSDKGQSYASTWVLFFPPGGSRADAPREESFHAAGSGSALLGLFRLPSAAFAIRSFFCYHLECGVCGGGPCQCPQEADAAPWCL